MISEPSLSAITLTQAADTLLLNDKVSEAMAAQSTKIGVRDAGERLYALILDAIGE